MLDMYICSYRIWVGVSLVFLPALRMAFCCWPSITIFLVRPSTIREVGRVRCEKLGVVSQVCVFNGFSAIFGYVYMYIHIQ